MENSGWSAAMGHLALAQEIILTHGGPLAVLCAFVALLIGVGVLEG